PKLTKEQEAELCQHIENSLYSTSAEIVNYIKQQYNINYTTDGLVITLHRLGFSYKKTKILPAKADRKKQEAFICEYEKMRKEQKSDEKVYFMDGVHPTHNVMPAYSWIKKGKEKEVRSNTGRERVNINGAYSPDDGDIITRKDGSINSQSTIELLKMIEKKNPDKNRIYVIADNARYYKAIIVKEYLRDSRIRMMHLPSYSPNLNLIERLWKFFKKKVLHNKYYQTIRDFEKAIDDFFTNGVKKYRPEIMRLLVERFQLFNSS
ncbi:MAG: IS630 family transposase, partial [Candidatus Pacebacteria bacterium]|nr:IS630 family transposase [Candidatus Paceibacterota bacterium]